VAKASDKSAGALDADKAGLLTGLFAEENALDRRALWRIATWGVAAVGAVVLAFTSNQWSIGVKHDHLAVADVARQAQQIQSLTKATQNEDRRLAAAIDTLNGDRDRLFSRVTVLEQGLDSVTGTIAKEKTAAATTANPVPKPPPSVAPPPATLMPPSAPPGDRQPQAATPPAPAVAPIASAAPAPNKPRIDAAKPEAAPEAALQAAPGAIAALPQIAAIKPAVPLARPPAPALGAIKSMMGPPDPAAPKLVEAAKPANAAPSATPAPARPPAAEIAAVAPERKNGSDNNAEKQAKAEDKSQIKNQGKNQDKSRDKSQDRSQDAGKGQQTAPADADAAKVQRTDFAVELGGANSIPGLRALWRGLLKSNKAELAELRPIIVLREGTNGLGMQLRLAAGPLQNAAEAAKICAALAERKRICETTVFDGQRLAMAADEEPGPNSKPAAVKPSNYRHYYAPRHVKKEEPPPPPKPESSTLSSLFGLNKH